MIQKLLLVAHVLIALGIIAFVLIQRGKGAEAGAAFGSGASGTVFGSRGSASFLTRTTSVLATAFFATSLALAFFANQPIRPGAGSVIGAEEVGAGSIMEPDVPAAVQEDELPDAPEGTSQEEDGSR
ncbi:MAG: preprotein translocase subunit SecG [Pseudomonadota bacterium]